jgi:hypothetical protein
MNQVVGGDRAIVLDEDAELAGLVDDGDTARHASRAEVLWFPTGSWTAPQDAGDVTGGYGFLMLEGMIVRRVGFEGRYGAELLAAGDLLRPSSLDGDDSLGLELAWRALTRVRLARLNAAWTERMGRYPCVGPALAGRALDRSRRLAAMLAIAQHPRLDERLWMLLWGLADRFGRVRSDGVHVDVPLTHEVLAHLAAARRPSVSGSLMRLARQGRVRREGSGWLLCGRPPSTG